MKRHHRSFKRNTDPNDTDEADLNRLIGVVAPEVLDAMRIASKQLTKMNVRHALVGGLAIGAYGYVRATRDVDFLVGDEAFEHHQSGMITIMPGIPIEANGVAVDPISCAENEGHLDDILEVDDPETIVPVLPLNALIYMKLKSRRKKDSADVIELIKIGIDAQSVEKYLEQYAPQYIEKFDQLCIEATTEDEE